MEQKKSKFIISSDNYWNLQRNNFLQLVFVFYILICPYIVVNNEFIQPKHQGFLLIFDFLFMLDRVVDLFVCVSIDQRSLASVIR